MNYFLRKNVLSIIILLTLAPLAHAMDDNITPKSQLEQIIDKLVDHSALLMRRFGPNQESNYLLDIAARHGNKHAINYCGMVNAETTLHIQRHRLVQGHRAFGNLCKNMRFNATDTDADLVAYRWFDSIIEQEFVPESDTKEIVGEAAFMLGSLCQMQRGVPNEIANKESAQNFFELAVQHGHKLAQERLAELGIQWQAPEPLNAELQSVPQIDNEMESQADAQPAPSVASATTSPLQEEITPQPSPAVEQPEPTTKIINATIFLKATTENKESPNTVPAKEEIRQSQTTAQLPLVAQKVRPERAKIKSADKGNVAEIILATIEKQQACHASKQVIKATPKTSAKKTRSSKKQKAPAKKIKNTGDFATTKAEIEKLDRTATVKKERDDAFELLSGLLTHFTQSTACKTIAASLKQTYKQYPIATDLYNYAYCQLQKMKVKPSELEGILLYLQGKYAAAQEKLSNIPICLDRNLVNWYLAHAIFYDIAQSTEPSEEVVKQIISTLEAALCMPIKKSQEYAKILKLDNNMITFLQERSCLSGEPDSTILTILSRIGIIFGHDAIGHEKDSISVMLEDLTAKSYANGRLCLAEMYLYGIGAEQAIDKAVEKLQEAILAPDKTTTDNELIYTIIPACTDISAKVRKVAHLKIPYLLLIHHIKTKTSGLEEIVECFKATESSVGRLAKSGVDTYNLIKETGLYDTLLSLAQDSPVIANVFASTMCVRIISNNQPYSEYTQALDIAAGHLKQYTRTTNASKNSVACININNIGAAKREAGLFAEALELFEHSASLVEQSSEEYKRTLYEIAITHCTGTTPNLGQGLLHLIQLAEDEQARNLYLVDNPTISNPDLLNKCEQYLITIQGALDTYNKSKVATRRATLVQVTNNNLFHFARYMIGYTAKQRASRNYDMQFYRLLKKASEINHQNATIIVDAIKKLMALQ